MGKRKNLLSLCQNGGMAGGVSVSLMAGCFGALLAASDTLLHTFS